MSANLKFTILGCGNSTGVPAIGNVWGACDPNEPKNRRTRPCFLVQSDTTTLIIDTGPDIKEQANRENITKLDAVMYTHGHGDHVHGIDEMRVFVHKQKQNLPLYTNHETLIELKRRFYYLFDGGMEKIYPPIFVSHELDEHYGKQMRIGDIDFIPFPQHHGHVVSVGFRFGDLAYSTDIKSLPPESIDILKGVKTWIVDAAGYHQENNPVHANLNEIYAMNEQIGADKVYLTSLSLAMDYQTLLNELPDGYEPAYDGQKL
jgi:phosphoribosyl 1,2-cyclic phosphate phosphodiesterase